MKVTSEKLGVGKNEPESFLEYPSGLKLRDRFSQEKTFGASLPWCKKQVEPGADVQNVRASWALVLVEKK